MSDFNSSLPVRTEHNGDVVAFIADATTPSQLAAVDSFGSQQNVLKDAAGNAIGSQNLSSSWWLQVVMPGTGPSAPGTASSFSVLAGGIYNATPPVLADAQQSSLQLDAAGRLLVDANINFTSDTNYGVVGSNTLRVASQIGNATGAADFNAGATGAQTLRVTSNISDAAGNALTSTSGSLNVNISNSTLAITQSGTWTVQSVQSGTWTVGLSEDHNYGAVGANTLRTAAQIGNSSGAADFNNGTTGAQTLRVAANLAVSGADVSPSNPVPVTVEAAPGSHINDYKDASAIAASASDNHDYTVTALKTLHLNQIEASASGKMKMVVQVETAIASGIFNTKFVKFNSTADTNISLHLDDDIVVAAGVRVRVIMSNLDKAAQDLYSSICGYEV